MSILAEGEDSKARGNNCPQTDRLWDVVSRLSETVGRHDAALALQSKPQPCADRLQDQELAVMQAKAQFLQQRLRYALVNMHQGIPVKRSREVVQEVIDILQVLELSIAEYRSA